MSNIEERTTTEHLACRLTREERAEKARKLADVVQNIASELEGQKGIKASLKARITELEAQQSQLAIVVSRGEEYRDVPVKIIIDYLKGVRCEVRTDTDEEILVRPLREEELQPALPGTD